MIVEQQPQVVLLDVHLPGGNGAEVIRRVADRAPQTRYLALSVSDAAEDVIATIRAGARGYVTKSISGPDLADCRPAGGGRRRRLLTAPCRVRARRLRGHRGRGRRSTRSSTG